MNRELADLKKPVKNEKHVDLAKKDKETVKEDKKETPADEIKEDVTADLKKPVADEKHTDVADLKKGKPDMDRTVADLKSGKPDMDRTVADLKSGKPDMNREVAEYKGYDAPTTDDNADKLAEKLSMAKTCIAKHLASLKKAHKKIQEAKRMTKANLELASFYKENGVEIKKRQDEVGLELASKISDKEILNDSKFSDLKLEKANLEVAKHVAVGSKVSPIPEDRNASLRKEIDDKAFGRKQRQS